MAICPEECPKLLQSKLNMQQQLQPAEVLETSVDDDNIAAAEWTDNDAGDRLRRNVGRKHSKRGEVYSVKSQMQGGLKQMIPWRRTAHSDTTS